MMRGARGSTEGGLGAARGSRVGDNLETLHLRIDNWERYQERRDVKASSWFRMEHGSYLDPAWDDVGAEEHHVWAWLLAYASFKNRGEITVHVETCAVRAKVSPATFRQAIQKLEKKLCLSVLNSSRTEDVTCTVRARDESGPLQTDRQTDNSSESDDSPPGRPGDGLPELARVWNEHCGKLPSLRSCKGRRRRDAKARWKENPSAEYWVSVIERIHKTPFLRGENRDGWRATFDWLVRPESADRVLEGFYDRQGARPTVEVTTTDDQEALL
jgi:hypothetical protein